ncbi:hypothetical protein QJS04_geneDACA012795 [Acorus gramineus]|uniref:Uncharacterized protein n=1 Tax=Acorus gramineus TaxID=55184 RepID=A0AAV9BH71_ACOGR|nr:hypothetical protein QJS04_geneDACA012795 [Acorus gramineus]
MLLPVQTEDSEELVQVNYTFHVPFSLIYIYSHDVAGLPGEHKSPLAHKFLRMKLCVVHTNQHSRRLPIPAASRFIMPPFLRVLLHSQCVQELEGIDTRTIPG